MAGQSLLVRKSILSTALVATIVAFLRWYARRRRRPILNEAVSTIFRDQEHLKETGKDAEQESADLGSTQWERQLTPQEEVGRNESFLKLILFMSKVPAFRNLDQAEYVMVARAFSDRAYNVGDTVMKQNDRGTELILIADGQAEVLDGLGDDQEHVSTLVSGDSFGEQELIRGGTYKATLVAKTALKVHVLSRDTFDKLGLSHKLVLRKKRSFVQTDADEDLRKSMDITYTQKTDAQSAFIKEAILANEKLGPLVSHLGSTELQDIIEHAYSMDVKPGTDVVHQGDIHTDLFYVVKEGKLEVIVQEHKVLELKSGTSFGELALLFRAPRAATVRATSEAKLWVIHRVYLRTVLQKPLQKKLEAYATLLGQVELFKDKSEADRCKVADALVETTFYKDECIIRQGEDGDRFFVLYDGQVGVDINGKEVSRLKSIPGEGVAQFFGERALLKNEPRAASIIVLSDKARVLALDRGTFLQVLKNEEDEKPMRPDNYIEYSRHNLKEIGLLGSGGFGAVTLVKDSATGLTFALKALSKGHVLKHRAERSVVNEKTILRLTSNPFLIRLAATFNSQEFLYFLLEPALGGDLITVYEVQGFHRSELHARFYLACVLRALEHLHSRFIVYRDLKPENLLIDGSGYCKVTDFGLSKFVIGHTYTTCGTPEFFAPEIISGGGYTKAVDWWALGAMTFEFMVGQSPFYANDHMNVMRKIKTGAINFPRSARHWPDLVQGLCMHDPSERLPLRTGGSANIEKHSWYTKDSFDWGAFNKREMKAPYVPRVAGNDDISNFIAAESDRPPQIPYKDPSTGWDKDFEDAWGPGIFD